MLQDALSNKQKSLSESKAQGLLREYKIPLLSQQIVSHPAEAVQASQMMQFPVVLKGIGPSLLHKTEKGLVHLNLQNPPAVKKAAAAIVQSAGNALAGILVQPFITGQREFVAGMFRDKQFGPVVMFGLGGIFAESLSDISFRVAPLKEIDAEEMLNEIKAKSLLGDFRGEKAPEHERLIQTIMGLARIGIEHPEIKEIDINPLKVTPKGKVYGVDSLVLIDYPQTQTVSSPPIDPYAIGSLFYPKSIAFVGASGSLGKWGHMLFTITKSGGFEGKIYLVNHKGDPIAGQSVYRSVLDIPDPVDLGVVTVPASKVMNLIPHFKAKGINNMLLITSGFGETGEMGKKLEQQLTAEVRKAGILMVGPNTMGICNPHIHLYCTGSYVRPRAGSTVVAAQSGNMGTQLLAFAEQQGIGIRGFCGSGNEAMVTIEDYLDAFEVDDLTRTVMLYVESVKNGRRFIESAARVGQKKPIILLKGGRNQAGQRAAASHTGALTTDSRIFDAICRQTGIVQVERPMDLLSLTAAFASLPLPRGNRAAIMTLGGGWGVVTADLCTDYGLMVPELSNALLERFDAMLPQYWSRSNPVDIVGERDPQAPISVMEELIKWDGCDAVINLGIIGRRIFVNRMADAVKAVDPTYSSEFLESIKNALSDFEKNYIAHIVRLMEKYQKPVFGVSLLPDEKNHTVYRVADQTFNGVFYTTPEQAVKAFAKMYEYKKFLDRG